MFVKIDGVLVFVPDEQHDKLCRTREVVLKERNYVEPGDSIDTN